MRLVPVILIVGLVLVPLIGCSPSEGVVVRGELRRHGERYRPAEGEQVMVTLAETTDGNVSEAIFPTRLGMDGTFEIAGPDQLGIRPGVYRVGVTSMPEVPIPGKPVVDAFEGNFDLVKSPLNVTIERGQGTITLELP
jgi:hypothetical protein